MIRKSSSTEYHPFFDPGLLGLVLPYPGSAVRFHARSFAFQQLGVVPLVTALWGGLYVGFGAPLAFPRQVVTILTRPFQPHTSFTRCD